MESTSQWLQIIPVLPSADIKRDLAWYQEKVGFEFAFGDEMYAGIRREHMELHLQWHADTQSDPLLGGSVIRMFVKNIHYLFEEFLQRGTVTEDKLRLDTPWNTHEFGFYDLNKNAIFIVQNL